MIIKGEADLAVRIITQCAADDKDELISPNSRDNHKNISSLIQVM